MNVFYFIYYGLDSGFVEKIILFLKKTFFGYSYITDDDVVEYRILRFSKPTNIQAKAFC